MKLALLRFVVAVVFGAVCLPGIAADLEVVSARQTMPGKVAVTVAVPITSALKPSELLLQLDNSPLIAANGVTNLGAATGPAWLVLCLDRSGSIGQAPLDSLKAGLVKALVDGRGENLPFRVSIIAFASQSRHVIDFTSDPSQVAAAVKPLTVDNAPGSRTKLHDAIAGGMAALRAQGEGGKRLIVVSDGKDEGSAISADKLAELAQGQPRITIDALALGALAQDHSGAISSFAGLSGGRFVAHGDSKDLSRPLQRLIADAIRLSRVDVTFDYVPAADNRTTQLAALQYTPENGKQMRQPLQAALVAQQVAGAVPQAQASQASPQQSKEVGIKVTFELVLDWLKNAPTALLAALAAALLALALGLGYRYRTVLLHTHTEKHEVIAIQPAPPTTPPRPQRAATAVGHVWQQPAPGRPAAVLRGIAGSSRGELVPVDKAQFSIGCDPENDLVLVGDDFASAAHALIRFEAGALYVEDLGSTNGTHLNGGTIKSATRSLSPGDELRFGHTAFKLQAPAERRGDDGPAGNSGFESPPG